MTYLDKSIQKRLDEKLSRLNKLRPLPKSAVEKLRDQFRIEMTYNSNAIEGNSLTLKETFLVINEGLTVRGKPLKDHLEAKDHYTALQYLYELIEHGKKNTLSEHLIKQIHTIILQETDKEWAGKYRNSNVIIGGADHTPPDALKVPEQMQDLIKWISKEKKKLHIVELAAIVHHRFVHIHPFFDGNGRTSRLLMNLVLMQVGFPLSIILKNDRKKYYDALNSANNGNYFKLMLLMAQAVERTLNIYLSAIPNSDYGYDIISNLVKEEQLPYGQDYISLLARQGKIDAYKEGRNWFTSKKAVEDYFNKKSKK